MSDLSQADMWKINREGWDNAAPRFYGAAALPNYGPFAPSETELNLIGDVTGKAVVEIGCGSGHSLLYMAQQGAGELWGLDLSSRQLEFAAALLKEHGVRATLLNAPMEQNPGIPSGHFDVAISIYALGWTTDLTGTLAMIHNTLKPGGFYVFSWENPFYSCLDYQNGRYILKEPYREHRFVEPAWNGAPIVMHQRQVSTFVNAALEVGFLIERMVEGEARLEQSQDADLAPEGWYSAPRARMVPPTMIMKLRKPETL